MQPTLLIVAGYLLAAAGAADVGPRSPAKPTPANAKSGQVETASLPQIPMGARFMPKAGAVFRIKGVKIPPARVAHPLRVSRMEKNWLWVGAAWIQRSDVIPLAEAEAYYSDFLTQEPRSIWALHCRAVARRVGGDLPGAEHDLGEAIRLSPGEVALYNARGNVAMERRRWSAAWADYHRALELRPDFAAAVYNRALAGERLGFYSRSIDDLQRAMQLDPRDMRPVARLAWLLATCPEVLYRDGPRARQLAEWLILQPQAPAADAYDTLAAAAAECGDFDAARQHAERALELAAGDFIMRPQVQQRLADYRRGIPCRQSFPDIADEDVLKQRDADHGVFQLLADGPSRRRNRQ